MPDHSDNEWRLRYESYIRSAKWRNMRTDMLRLRGNRCERCGDQYSLQLHHKTYERLGRELIADLEVLCTKCHEIADRERAEQGAIRSANARYDAGLWTYATKKYGDDWAAYRDPSDVEEEFDEWLVRQPNHPEDE
jgi:hypothetical protein